MCDVFLKNKLGKLSNGILKHNVLFKSKDIGSKSDKDMGFKSSCLANDGIINFFKGLRCPCLTFGSILNYWILIRLRWSYMNAKRVVRRKSGSLCQIGFHAVCLNNVNFLWLMQHRRLSYHLSFVNCSNVRSNHTLSTRLFSSWLFHTINQSVWLVNRYICGTNETNPNRQNSPDLLSHLKRNKQIWRSQFIHKPVPVREFWISLALQW